MSGSPKEATVEPPGLRRLRDFQHITHHRVSSGWSGSFHAPMVGLIVVCPHRAFDQIVACTESGSARYPFFRAVTGWQGLRPRFGPATMQIEVITHVVEVDAES